MSSYSRGYFVGNKDKEGQLAIYWQAYKNEWEAGVGALPQGEKLPRSTREKKLWISLMAYVLKRYGT